MDDGPYAGVDLPMARRFAAIGWLIAIGVAAGLVPFFPPTAAIGDAGWAVMTAAILGLGGYVMLVVSRGGGGISLLVTSIAGCLVIAVLEWLAGAEEPYGHLYLFVVMSSALVQPPPRLAVVVVLVAVARFAPLIHDPDAFRPGDAVIEVLVWTGFAVFLHGLIVQLRMQRQALQRYGDEAERSARSDALTGLRNRRAFDEEAELELARHQRSGEPLTLVVLDLDGLKQINDRHGHQAGDDALRAVADALKHETRAIDGCYRWGGDEFAMLLPGADRASAEAIGVRISARLEGRRLRAGGLPVSASSGMVEIQPAMSIDDAVAAADAELFEVKRRRAGAAKTG
jgi:diguanylate cyclase (GGDEF)-like protein